MAALAAATVAALAVPGTAQGSGRPAPAVQKSATPTTVTLLTGDRVTVGAGPKPEVSVQRAPGATGSLRVTVEDGHTFAYPDAVLPYLADGRLDRRLFDVTGLIEQGYDDAHAASLPLIVTHGTAKEPALPGTETTLDLPVIHGKAVRANRSKSAALWSALTGKKGPEFAAGVDRVWLDGRSHGTLADSTAQIGAPAVWANGGTGAGVRVAVLDTGIDATHPDLKDRIVESRSFVPGQEVTDRFGHGTHTASTVAGTGAASGGTEKGVAPGADLVVGKVLSDQNSGQDSWIIAGMEWAARTEHARVISMSLGSNVRNGQDNPLSQALNRLSAETGALFVVAAGNDGEQGSYTLGSPGTADAALTVGAVDGRDRLAPFSSVGPREDDDGLKPDITAPGVGIVAARSQFMDDGGEGFYRSSEGTSMATPHVAGAAVLVAQKHPDWTAAQIKDALMSTSVRTPDYSPYQAGSGRVSVPGAYWADVFATGSVDAGLVKYGTEAQPITKPVTYTNTTDAPITLDLAVDGSPAFALDAEQVTVPAHGTARAELTADPGGLAAGQYTAQVTARFDGGVIHTATGFVVEAEKYALTMSLKGQDGEPAAGVVDVRGADGSSLLMEVPESGSVTRRLPPGSYTAFSSMDVRGLHGAHSLGFALLAAPEIELTGDRTVELDASRVRQVKVDTAKPSAVTQSRIDVYRNWASAEPVPDWSALFDVQFPSPAYDSLWALPTGKVKKGSFVFGTRIRAVQTPLALSYQGRRIDDALTQPGSGRLADGTRRLDAVFAGTGSEAEYDGVAARGKAVVVRASDRAPAELAAAAEKAGAAMLLVVNQDPGRRSDAYDSALPVASLGFDEGEALIGRISGPGGVKLAVEAHPSPEYLYDLADYHVGAIPADPSAGTDPGDLARVDLEFAVPAGMHAVERRADFPPYEWPGTAAPSLAAEPVAAGSRTDWVSAGAGRSWRQYGTVAEIGETRTGQVAYEPGSTQGDRWFGPVTRPRLLEDGALYRGADTFSAFVEAFGDAGAAHSGQVMRAPQRVELYQGDELLFQADAWPWVGASGLAPEELPYRMVVETHGDPELSPYSSQTRTEWRFRSEAADEGKAVPLVQLDYGTGVDLAGRAGRRSDVMVTPSVLGSASAADAVSSLGVEVSYDDGKTWRRTDPKELRGGAWQAALDAPSGAAFVSLRVSAGQHNGGGVTQTVIRAFGLK
ncbi:S8 family serine peptidase [Streptomyces smaragdinus]|uniref:S8 family serine peptidase n=1 Tax=Streptomyces smaragdinus TaxID=2585196 RepID=UPI002B21B627|nr:S8 family serine peptidase [Streptomyces smaragdinus]